MTLKVEPRFKHDCNECVFHGYYNHYDIYKHSYKDCNTIILRESDEGSDYLSLSEDLVEQIPFTNKFKIAVKIIEENSNE